ncbi:MAG: ribosome silencing factor, partial [Candidatus Nanopelagicales bacterium]
MAATERAIDWTIRAALAAAEKKAGDIVAIDVSEKLAITDVFLILTGSNDRQVRAIADAVEEALDLIDVDPVRREGTQQGRWILL